MADDGFFLPSELPRGVVVVAAERTVVARFCYATAWVARHDGGLVGTKAELARPRHDRFGRYEARRKLHQRRHRSQQGLFLARPVLEVVPANAIEARGHAVQVEPPAHGLYQRIGGQQLIVCKLQEEELPVRCE